MQAATGETRLLGEITGNGILRVASGASTVLVGAYIADLNRQGVPMGAGLVGGLAATAFGAELAGSIPLGILSDLVPVRALMFAGALLAAAATLLFGLTFDVRILVASRILEGLAAAVGVPPMLAYLTAATASRAPLRARAMSYFELSLLAGLAFGGIVAGQLWNRFGVGAFIAVSLLYVMAALLLLTAQSIQRLDAGHSIFRSLAYVLALPSVRRLAPVWLCMNVIIGLWLGPTFYFLLTRHTGSSQWLDGLFAGDVAGLGWLLFAYTLVFGTGVVIWSRLLATTDLRRALRVSLVAMLGVCVALGLLNHMSGAPAPFRWIVVGIVALLIMIESGFTPAALSLLAASVGKAAGRGGTMGVYSFLLSLGALAGSVVAGFAGQRFAIDGLIAATAICATVALALSDRLNHELVAVSSVN